MAWKPAYVTPAELRDHLGVNQQVSDTRLSEAAEAASRAIDLACNRQFGVVAVAEERFYTARFDFDRRRWVVPIDDLMSTTDFVAEVQDADGIPVGVIDDYVLEPRNANLDGRPWIALMVRSGSTQSPTGATDEVAITALWGWSAVPTAVKAAAKLQASRFLARKDSPYGVAGSPDLGNELRLLARLDVDVAEMVKPYQRWWGAA